MSDERNNRGSNEEPGSQGVNAAVGFAGEPSRSQDTRDLAAEEAGVSPEELDALEEKFTGPRKPMGPPEPDVPETTPEES